MLFNSIDFLVFLPLVFAVFWLLNKYELKYQNLLLLVASYIFYGWWDWRFLSLIFFSTIVDFQIGQFLSKTEDKKKRKLALSLSLIVNLGLLGYFKYYNFFIENFIEAFTFLGYQFEAESLNVILPVGISFYTFQTLSYTIDVYNKKLTATNNFTTFAAFVSFFPQLVAGPIERATNLLPQFDKRKQFDYHSATNGLRQILWGFFKKIVIADNCAEYVNYIFSNSETLNGSTLLIGALFFAFQIYGDFSGYSDIAIGTARLFGFNLMQNFAFPYFSRDIAEFWRRWHISLSTWFRDYLYIPLGGSRGGTMMKVRNTFIIFIVSGFWHGANWTFIIWGALNAIYFLPLLLTKRNRTNLGHISGGNYLPSFKEAVSILLTFSLTIFAWIFFRANDVTHAFQYISEIFSNTIFDTLMLNNIREVQVTLLILVFFIISEWHGKNDQYALEKLGLKWPKFIRWSYYSLLIFAIGMFMPTSETTFIYFQF